VSSIGIVGTGISGLTLALMLQQQDVDAVVYTDRTADELRGGRLPNTVVRYGGTIPRERSLGVNHWDGIELGSERIYFSAVGAPISFSGPMPNGGSCVDFRMYLPQLVEDFEERGGPVVIGPTGRDDLVRLAEIHDLVVVASGRDVTAALFPRDADRSVHSVPQRLVCAGFWHGVEQLDRPGVTYSLAPGVGEMFHAPFLSRDGVVSAVLVEALPGGPLAPLVETRYEDDPTAFEALMLRLLRDHAPSVFERVTASEFHLTGPLDLFQGALTPTVRRSSCELTPRTFAVAVGDAWIVNDPITGQGANLGSACAAELASSIVEHDVYDEQFCQEVDRRLWAIAEPVCRFTNAFLEPPPPHVLQILLAATESQRVADAFTSNFGNAAAMCDAIATEEGAARFLQSAARGVNPDD
jgi:2-polyprenyl-6-methoxyphenol hydroxylase-like FAD-dependent oxidoreductase